MPANSEEAKLRKKQNRSEKEKNRTQFFKEWNSTGPTLTKQSATLENILDQLISKTSQDSQNSISSLANYPDASPKERYATVQSNRRELDNDRQSIDSERREIERERREIERDEALLKEREERLKKILKEREESLKKILKEREEDLKQRKKLLNLKEKQLNEREQANSESQVNISRRNQLQERRETIHRNANNTGDRSNFGGKIEINFASDIEKKDVTIGQLIQAIVDAQTRTQQSLELFRRGLQQSREIIGQLVESLRGLPSATDFLQTLPHDNPYRRSLMYWCISNFKHHDHLNIVNKENIINIFYVSQTTVYRLNPENTNINNLHRILYTPNTKKVHFTEDQIDKWYEVMDGVLPFLSGRDFRLQAMTNEAFYQKVRDECARIGIPPPSENYMYTRFLREELIHHTKYDAVCKDCAELKKLETIVNTRRNGVAYPADSEKGKKMAKLKLHQTIAVVQRQLYSQQKVDVINDLDGTSAIILMDFSQLSHQQSLRQALIISVYCHKDNASYFNYVSYVAPTTTTKNDPAFVKISTFQRDTDIPLYTVDQVIELIRTMRNHYAEVACPTHKVPKSPTTMKNISKCHRFIFDVANNRIIAYEYSGKQGPPLMFVANNDFIQKVVDDDPRLNDELDYLLEA
ncbi:hypothetical protein PPL_01914 [Heterostelium album PN500]|uniref:Uncharacterized protein n=1 Tax=Heterostelium pallidum (strain ATCC 26659 / Pp 5 / PN500) TaxID=670386 RepID=D3B0U7_HETP5|nr:hypothetical protein PPL_01914 [Heterostelium album PN500]EFA84921.1 hypothetical protein PPL_01914 [Heterostelium album PN500]|eukprot:XP_020437031.1 hypothetical protein PPL_01914 [Heterostelium album PN500]